MHIITRLARLPVIPTICLFTALSTQAIFAVEPDHDSKPNLSAQLLFGTAGLEPGIAAEWRFRKQDLSLALRPELFINEDGRIGGGASVGWVLDGDRMSNGHDLTIGPRVAYHNSDDHGWELSAMAIYSLPLSDRLPRQHFLQIIGAAGILQDRSDGDKAGLGGTLGAAYQFRF